MHSYKIRSVEPGDTTALRNIYAWYVEHTHVSFEYSAPSETEFGERIAGTTAEFPWIVCTHNEKVIGYACAHKHRLRDAYRWSPESTIYLDARFHSKGVGRILYHTLFGLLRLQGYRTVFAGVALPNEKSVGVHVKMGFEQIGVFKNVGFKAGRWYDTCWFQLGLRSSEGEPELPVKFPDIRGNKEYKQVFDTANQQLSVINQPINH